VNLPEVRVLDCSKVCCPGNVREIHAQHSTPTASRLTGAVERDGGRADTSPISKAFESSPGLHSTPSHEGKLAVRVEESTGVIAHDLVYNSYCFRFVVLDPVDGDRHACQSIV
jgi:hypothetical protein